MSERATQQQSMPREGKEDFACDGIGVANAVMEIAVPGHGCTDVVSDHLQLT